MKIMMAVFLNKISRQLIINAFWVLNGLHMCMAQPMAPAAETERQAWPTGMAIVDQIQIEGAKKTRRATILRELEFSVGDTLMQQEIDAILERNRLRIMNLGIFSNSELSVQPLDAAGRLAVNIRVTEGWYILPVPLMSLADRNFNVWWSEFNRSFKRVNYGLDWTQLNVSGRADALKVKAQFGYTNRYELYYRLPGINRKRTIGFETSIAYSRAHEVAYNTAGNKLQFLKISDIWLSEQFYASATFSSRPKYFATQSLTLEYRDNRIADTVSAGLNRDFFLNASIRQRHASVVYNLTHDHRDIRPYPLSGWRAIGELRWNGLLPGDDLFLGRLFGQFDQYFKLSSWFSLETSIKGRFSYPRQKLPWINNQALGYGGNFVRGFEYYVIDGLDFAILRTSMHFRILSGKYYLGKWMPVKAYRQMQLEIYLAANADAGYANDPYYAAQNPLANRVLFGYGPGIDIVAWYDKTIRLEWSWNDLGERAFFLRINTGF